MTTSGWSSCMNALEDSRERTDAKRVVIVVNVVWRRGELLTAGEK